MNQIVEISYKSGNKAREKGKKKKKKKALSDYLFFNLVSKDVSGFGFLGIRGKKAD